MLLQSENKKIIKKQNELRIEKIILEDFKSYGGKKVIGPLDQNMTSVVGPNGSGKSNLIESLLFVFGKKASWMRLKNLNQLIHKKDNQMLNQASVEVIFTEQVNQNMNEDNYINIQFSVKRVVFQNSSTKYYIDGVESQQREVVELLKNKGIDLENNRFLILQGEVEQISLMKPKSNNQNETGFLEYLEEIIGSNKYKQDIEQYEEENEKLQAEKRGVNELVRVAEEEVIKLENDKNKAMKYVQTEKQLYNMQNVNNQILRYTSNTKIIEFQQQQNIQQEMMKQQQQVYQQVNEKFKKIQQNINHINQKQDQIKEKLIINKEQQQQREKEDDKKKHELEQIINKISQIQKSQYEQQKQSSIIQQQIQQLEIEIPVAQEQNNQLLNQKQQIEQQFNKIEQQVNQQTQQLKNKINPIKKQIDEININIKQQELNQKEINTKLNEIQNYKKSQKLQELQDRFDQITEQINQKKELLQKYENSKKTIQKLESEKNQQLESLKSQLESLKNNLQKKEEELEFEEIEQKSENIVINKLLEAQQKGKLKGIMGRLGDMGVIEKKYDIAVSTCGGQLNNLVVDSKENGQKVLEYLRENKIGRLTLFPLDQMEHNFLLKSQQEFRCPNQSQRLFDLIQVQDNRLKAIFYNVFKDTLVVQDLEQAKHIGYNNKMRVITTDGILIETSGVISGGGQKRSGLMGDKYGPTYIQFSKSNNLNQNNNNNNNNNNYNNKQIIMQQIEETQHKIRQVCSNIIKNKEEIAKLGEENQQLHNEYKIEIKNLEYSQKNCEKIKLQIDEILNQQRQMQNPQDLQNQLLEIQQLLQNLNKQKEPLIYNQQQIQQQIDQKGGQDYVQQRQKLEDIKKQYEQSESKLQELQTKNNSLVKRQQLGQENQQKFQADFESNEKKQEQIKCYLQQLEYEMEQLMNEEEQIKQLEEQSNNEIKELKKDYDEYKQNNENILNQLEAIKKKIQEYKSIIEEQKKEYQRLSSEIDKIRAKYRQIQNEYDLPQEIMNEIVEEDQNQQLNQTILNESFLNQSMIEDRSFQADKKKEMQNLYSEIFKKHKLDSDIQQEELKILEQTQLSKMLIINITFDEEKLQKMNPNIKSIKDYYQRYQLFKERKQQQQQILERLNNIKAKNDELRKKRYEEFISGFNIINAKLKEVYQLLTESGDAELELLDSLDPFSEGVVFSVRPPKKSWKQMIKLSGGEKTLSSLAFIFALHHYKPNPLYFMDEIDAALDFKNVAIVAKYIKERAKNAQFIIISLRNHMFEIADRLIGIYKTYDITKTIMFQPKISNNSNDDKQLRNSSQKNSQKKSQLKAIAAQ